MSLVARAKPTLQVPSIDWIALRLDDEIFTSAEHMSLSESAWCSYTLPFQYLPGRRLRATLCNVTSYLVPSLRSWRAHFRFACTFQPTPHRQTQTDSSSNSLLHLVLIYRLSHKKRPRRACVVICLPFSIHGTQLHCHHPVVHLQLPDVAALLWVRAGPVL